MRALRLALAVFAIATLLLGARAQATPVWLAPQKISDLLAIDATTPLTVWNNHNAYQIDISTGASVTDYLPNSYHAIYTGCASDGNEGISTTITQTVTGSTTAQTVTVNAIQTIVVGTNLLVSDGANTEIVNVTATAGNTVTGVFTKNHGLGVTVTGACKVGSGTGAFSANELLTPGATNVLGTSTPITWQAGSCGHATCAFITMNVSGSSTLVPVDAIIYDDEAVNAPYQTTPNEIANAVYYAQQVCQEAHAVGIKCIVTPGDDIFQEVQASNTWPNIQCNSSTVGWDAGISNYDGTQGRCAGFAFLINLMSQNLEPSGSSGQADLLDIQDQTLTYICGTDCTELLDNVWQEQESLHTGTIGINGNGSHGGQTCYPASAMEASYYSAEVDPVGPLAGGVWYNYSENSGGTGCTGFISKAQEADQFLLWYAAGTAAVPSPYYSVNPQLSIGASSQKNTSNQAVTLCSRQCSNGGYQDGYAKFGVNQAGYKSPNHPTGSTQGYIQSANSVAVVPTSNATLSATAGLTNFTWIDGQFGAIRSSKTMSPPYDSFVWEWPAASGKQATFSFTSYIYPRIVTIYYEHQCAPITVSASLSDSSAPAANATISEPTDGKEYDGNVPVTFASATNDQTLTLTLTSGTPYSTGSCSGSGTVGIAAYGINPGSPSYALQRGTLSGKH